MTYTRREILRMGLGAGAALALGRRELTAAVRSSGSRQDAQLLKVVPSSGERIPAVGLGTASSFSSAARTPEEHDALREVLRGFTEMGGSVIDTAPSYGRGASEETLGELVREIGNADEIFMATKISGAEGRAEGMEQFERSLELMSPVTIDLEQVHNLGDWQTQLPLLRELKEERRIRYVGITTSRDSQYDELAPILRNEELDFVQFDYAIDNRNAEDELIPIAQDRGIATLVNGPFGRTRLFSRAGDRPVPDWAREFGAETWAQFFLKWLLGHPAITVVIPATSDPEHLRDNMRAGYGRVPDEEERRRMQDLVDSWPAARRG